MSAGPTDQAILNQLRESRFQLRLLLIRFPGYDRPEILRRLTAYERGERIAPAPIDRSSMRSPRS
ncbi:hypothetical protein [Actinoplanes sp. NPDC051411]|uniref:hypothetical protein n=1 Tax=Actinoplanes sp. NPDC051411 TaxID=3155522 RepID=UPI00342D8CA8